MRRYRITLCLALPLLVSAHSLLARAQKPDESELRLAATQFVNLLVQGDYALAEKQMDLKMKEALPEAKLRESWQQVLEQVGKFQQISNVRLETVSQHDVAHVIAAFEQATLEIKLAFNRDKQIAGLHFLPAEASAPSFEYAAPEYVVATKFDEREVTVGAAPWTLPGTLSMPKGKGPFPAIVLLHGSGPQDRDETIGANKPFRDLAGGLASRGIAVLRYEKRTKAYPAQTAQLPNLTVEQETLADAHAALALLAKTDGIRADRIFLLGHSLGGYLVPRVAQSDPTVHGVILFAASSRPIEEMVVQQTQYLLTQRGAPVEETRKKVNEVQQQANRVKAIQPGDTGSYFGIPASYWLDLQHYDPVATAKSLAMPILILQGARDYQVTTQDDLLRWKLALNLHKNVTLRVYNKLNHLFEEGDGPSTPAEYEGSGHVAEYVIGDLAQWVTTQSK